MIVVDLVAFHRARWADPAEPMDLRVRSLWWLWNRGFVGADAEIGATEQEALAADLVVGRYQGIPELEIVRHSSACAAPGVFA